MQCLTMLYQLHWKNKHQIWPLWHIISILSVIYTLFIWSHWGIFSVSTDWLIPKVISQCDIKPIMVSLIKTIPSVLKTRHTLPLVLHIILTDLLCAVIRAIMSVSVFITAIILYISWKRVSIGGGKQSTWRK